MPDSSSQSSDARMRRRIRSASEKFDFTALITGVHPDPPSTIDQEPSARVPTTATAVPAALTAGAQSLISAAPVQRWRSYSQRVAWRETWRLIWRLAFCLWVIAVGVSLGVASALVVEETTRYRVLAVSRLLSVPATATAAPKTPLTVHKPLISRDASTSEPDSWQYLRLLLVGLAICWLVWALWIPPGFSPTGRIVQLALIATCLIVAVFSGLVGGMITMEHYRHAITVDLSAFNKQHPRHTAATRHKHR